MASRCMAVLVVHKLVKVRYSSLDHYNVYTMFSLIPYNWLHLKGKNLVKFETPTSKTLICIVFFQMMSKVQNFNLYGNLPDNKEL